MVVLHIIKQQEYYTVYRVSIFLFNNFFNFLLNNCNDLISFKLFGKLFHIIAPLYLTEKRL